MTLLTLHHIHVFGTALMARFFFVGHQLLTSANAR